MGKKLTFTVTDENGTVLDRKTVELKEWPDDLSVIRDSNVNYVCRELCQFDIGAEPPSMDDSSQICEQASC